MQIKLFILTFFLIFLTSKFGKNTFFTKSFSIIEWNVYIGSSYLRKFREVGSFLIIILLINPHMVIFLCENTDNWIFFRNLNEKLRKYVMKIYFLFTRGSIMGFKFEPYENRRFKMLVFFDKQPHFDEAKIAKPWMNKISHRLDGSQYKLCIFL